ncbi:MAG: hypothetical protein R3C03_13490 [Pirellulaceae bacterium]
MPSTALIKWTSVVDRRFQWPVPEIDVSRLKVGITKPRREDAPEDPTHAVLRDMGCELVEVELPSDYPWQSLANIIDIEGAAVFNDLLRANETEGWNTWTETFRSAQFITAIDYIKMQRVRKKLMHAFEELMSQVDILWNTRDLIYTNFTGHPSVVFPTSVDERNGQLQPRTAVATGRLFDEETVLAFCDAFVRHSGSPAFKPPIEDWLVKFDAGELEPKSTDDEANEQGGKAQSDAKPKNGG